MVNKVILVGNLGADPEYKELPSGAGVCKLRLATAEKFKDRDGNMQERTEWHSVVVFGKTAEVVQTYCSKGKQLYIEGRIQTRKWQDKDGADRYSTEVIADNVRFLGGKGGDGDGGDKHSHTRDEDRNTGRRGAPQHDDDGDIPF